MTRRQAATAASSPRSFAASSTSQAATTDDAPAAGPSVSAVRGLRSTVRNVSMPASMHLELTGRTGIGRAAGLARLIELQNAPGGLDVEGAELALEFAQIGDGDAVILGAEKQQRHGRTP